jgi:hypothetical protein
MSRIVTLLLTALTVTAAPEWQRHEVYRGDRVNSAVAIDCDGDGRKEIIASSEGKVWLLTGADYKTRHTLAELSPLTKRKSCMHSTVMDVDGDGDLDFVGSAGLLFWAEQPNENPIGSPWPVHLITDEMFGTHCVRAFDWDRDGSQELYGNNFQPHKKYPHSLCRLVPKRTDGKVAWAITPIIDKTAPGGSHYFDFGDLDGDGLADLTLGAKGGSFENGNYFAIYTAKKGSGSWERRDLPDAGKQLGATHATPADVNGDGKLDVVASRGHGRGVIWFEAPNWRQHVIDAELDCPHATDVADIDGDGDLDVASVGFQSKHAVWYENDGKGTFTRHLLAENQEAYDVLIVDLNGDGKQDILVAGRGSNNVVWFQQK